MSKSVRAVTVTAVAEEEDDGEENDYYANQPDVEEEDEDDALFYDPPPPPAAASKKTAAAAQPQKRPRPTAAAAAPGAKTKLRTEELFDDPPSPPESPMTKKVPILPGHRVKKPIQQPREEVVHEEDDDDEELDPYGMDETPDDQTAFMSSLSSMTEKERLVAMAAYLKQNQSLLEDEEVGKAIPEKPAGKKKARTDALPLPPPPPPPPTAKGPIAKKAAVASKKSGGGGGGSAAAAASTAAAAAANPMFPHEKDVERVGQFVKHMAFTLLKTGVMGGVSEDEETTAEHIQDEGASTQFYLRYVIFRAQLIAGLKALFARSPYMSGIIGAMAVSKLIIFGVAKPLFAVDEVPAMCAWSGKRIDNPGEVRAVALVPLTEFSSQSASVPLPSEAPIPSSPVMFHINHQFSNMFKCINTLLFFIDALNSEIVNKVSTVSSMDDKAVAWDLIYGEEGGGGDGKKGGRKLPISQLCATAQMQLVKCVAVMRTILPDESHFIVRTPKS